MKYFISNSGLLTALILVCGMTVYAQSVDTIANKIKSDFKISFKPVRAQVRNKKCFLKSMTLNGE